jgi:hypothetical protein
MLNNFFDPAILFFLFGMLAGLLKSNLEIPQPISKFLSLYLLMALGLKGGFALAQSGITTEVSKGLGAAIFLAVLIPVVGYQILKRLTDSFNAAVTKKFKFTVLNQGSDGACGAISEGE